MTRALNSAPASPAQGEATPVHNLDELRQRRAWLAWQWVPSKKQDGKPRKVPVYAAGSQKGRWRNGEQNSPDDLASLATFDQARRFAKATKRAGVGLALRADLGVVCLDFDNVVQAGAVDADVAALVQDTYAEFSPSGNGVRAIVLGELPDGWRDRKEKEDSEPGAKGFETFVAKGFVTITGNELQHVPDLALVHRPGHLGPVMPALLAHCGAKFGSATREPKKPAAPAAPLTESELARLRLALKHIAMHDKTVLSYMPWVKVLMAIHETCPDDATAHALAHEFSAALDNYDAGETDEKLASFERGKEGNAGAGSIFMRARDCSPQWFYVNAPEDFDIVTEADVRALEEAEAAIRKAAEAAKPPPFTVLELPDIGSAAGHVQRWWWDQRVPAGEVTRMDADGGTGKTLIMLMAAVCIAGGIPLFGVPTTQGRVVFYSGEDPADVLLPRLAKCATELGVAWEVVQANVRLIDATEGDPVLFTRRRKDGIETGVTTRTYDKLADEVREFGASVVIIDNASDAFDGDEINRNQQRGFARALARLVRPTGGAVLLLGHVDKATARAGASVQGNANYSGSSAVHNSVRSRFFLLRVNDTGALELKHEKWNRSVNGKQPTLTLAWPAGKLPTVTTGAATDAVDVPASSLVPLLKRLVEFSGRGEFIACATRAGNSAKATVGEEMVRCGELAKPAMVYALIRAAERQGLIRRAPYTSPNRNKSEVWFVEDAAHALIKADDANQVGTAEP